MAEAGSVNGFGHCKDFEGGLEENAGEGVQFVRGCVGKDEAIGKTREDERTAELTHDKCRRREGCRQRAANEIGSLRGGSLHMFKLR